MAYRKGLVLQFGMVTCIVQIDGAVGKDESLKSVCLGANGLDAHVPTPITQQKVCKTCGPVAYTDLHKAREVGTGQYQIVDQQEVAAVRDATQGATKKMLTLTVHEAADVAEQTLYTEGVYYVAPEGPAQIGAYSLLLDAVQRHPEYVFLSRYTVSSVVSTYQLKAFNGQLVIAKIVDPEQIKAKTFSDMVEPDEALRGQIDMVLSTMVTEFDPDSYRNTYAESLEALLASKATTEGEVPDKPAKADKTVATAGVVDLSAQLNAMLAGSGSSTPPAKAVKPKKAKSA